MKLSSNILVTAFLMVCVLLSGCSLIQEDGADRHLLRAKLDVSVLGGPTNTRLVTNATETTLQNSQKPSIRETEIEKAMINKGLVERKTSILAYNNRGAGNQ